MNEEVAASDPRIARIREIVVEAMKKAWDEELKLGDPTFSNLKELETRLKSWMSEWNAEVLFDFAEYNLPAIPDERKPKIRAPDGILSWPLETGGEVELKVDVKNKS